MLVVAKGPGLPVLQLSGPSISRQSIVRAVSHLVFNGPKVNPHMLPTADGW